MSARDGEAIAERAEDGQFHFKVAINGTELPMVYDDDILFVTLRAEDAKRLGLVYERLDFSTKIKTVNGFADVAGIIIQTMTIGTITYHRVPGYAAREGALAQNILGHSFIGRLSAYRIENDRLILTAAKASMSDSDAAGSQKRASSIAFPRLP
jgi:aspartyl protease family protein